MTRPRGADDLLAERGMSPDEVWDRAEARLDRPVSEGLNMAHETVDRWARDRSRLALVLAHEDGTSERWTFADLAYLSNRFARALAGAGLRRGDRVAAVVTRQIEAYAAAIATWRAGMVYVPLFAGLGREALAMRLNSSGAAAVVVDHRFREAFEGVREDLDADPVIICVAGPSGRGLRRGDLSFWSEVDRHPADFQTVATAADETATLMYTSGTTGPPKGCMQPHSVILNIQPFVRHVMALAPSDLLFTTADPGWTYGLHATGSAVMALGLPRVVYTGAADPAAWLRAVERERATYLASAPSAYRALIAQTRRVPLAPSVRGATSAGEPLDAPLAGAWAALGVADLQDAYGQSESAMMLGNLAHAPEAIVPGALSHVVPGFEVSLVDEDGTPAAGDTGIIALRRPRYQAANGYWNAPEKWAERWVGDLFLTGDLARRDDAGRWWYAGRAYDVIVTSGYNVGPTEIESVILEHPAVRDAAVVAHPDPDRGSVVRAVLVTDGSVPKDALTAALQQAVRDRVGRHAYPRIVDVVEELPRTETGKLRRNVLRETAQQDARG